MNICLLKQNGKLTACISKYMEYSHCNERKLGDAISEDTGDKTEIRGQLVVGLSCSI